MPKLLTSSLAFYGSDERPWRFGHGLVSFPNQLIELCSKPPRHLVLRIRLRVRRVGIRRIAAGFLGVRGFARATSGAGAAAGELSLPAQGSSDRAACDRAGPVWARQFALDIFSPWLGEDRLVKTRPATKVAYGIVRRPQASSIAARM
jgi:hypothetical protein